MKRIPLIVAALVAASIGNMLYTDNAYANSHGQCNGPNRVQAHTPSQWVDALQQEGAADDAARVARQYGFQPRDSSFRMWAKTRTKVIHLRHPVTAMDYWCKGSTHTMKPWKNTTHGANWPVGIILPGKLSPNDVRDTPAPGFVPVKVTFTVFYQAGCSNLWIKVRVTQILYVRAKIAAPKKPKPRPKPKPKPAPAPSPKAVCFIGAAPQYTWPAGYQVGVVDSNQQCIAIAQSNNCPVAGQVRDANGNCVNQANAAEQNCYQAALAWPGSTVNFNNNTNTCTITQVNANCSNVIIIIGGGSPTITQQGNCNNPPPTCPPGTTGTPPNCVTPTCPTGTVGTPPNCTVPVCPPGTVGTPPNCTVPVTPVVHVTCTGPEEVFGGKSLLIDCGVSTNTGQPVFLDAHSNDSNSYVSGINCYSANGAQSCPNGGTFEFRVNGVNANTLPYLMSSVTVTATSGNAAPESHNYTYKVDPACLPIGC